MTLQPSQQHLQPGITFIVRIHNEEATLDAAVRSLFDLLMAYEILLILHLCTDASARIAQQLAAERPHLIRILTYNTTVARPGFETLVTPDTSPHSIAAYNNWALQHRRYLWTARWDADFIAPPSLRTYLNGAATDLWHKPDQLIWIGAEAPTHTEYHPYFSSCLSHYMKHFFNEVPIFRFNPAHHVRHTPPVKIEHRSTGLRTLKPYWQGPPWFDQEESPEAHAARILFRQLLQALDLSAPPPGLGRSGDTDTTRWGSRILDAVTLMPHLQQLELMGKPDG
jgi:hypothetical protein